MNDEEFIKEVNKLMNCIENNTESHWKNYYKDVDIERIYIDLILDINEIKRLTEENKKLNNLYEQQAKDYYYMSKENESLTLELSGYRQAILNNDELMGLQEEKEKLEKILHNINTSGVENNKTPVLDLINENKELKKNWHNLKEHLSYLLNSCGKDKKILKYLIELMECYDRGE